MKRYGFLLVLLAAGCAANVDGPPANGPDPGLVLRVEMLTPSVLMAGQSPGFKIALANGSAVVSYRVVKPGDGSEVGWRDPYIHWTGEIDLGDGEFVPLTKVELGRCGLMNRYGDEDVIRLAPGEELPLHFTPSFEFQQAGKVRLYAHYEYHAGQRPRHAKKSNPVVLPSMNGVAPFTVTSPPVEFDIVRPYDAKVTVRKALKANATNRLSDILDVTFVNNTSRAIRCDSHYSCNVRLDLQLSQDDRGSNWLETDSHSDKGEVPGVVEANGTMSLVWPSRFAGDFNGTIKTGKPGSLTIRAVCYTHIDEQELRIFSEWVTIPIKD